MGEKAAQALLDHERRLAFMRRLLEELRALEFMLERGMIEQGVARLGVEQELFLVDRDMRPAPLALKLLERLDDRQFTTELGLFNLELNLDPLGLGGDCLSRMERDLERLLERLRRAAHELEGEIVLTGILPTVRMSDLTLDNMTPKPRYQALNHAMSALRGGAYEFHIKGLDELLLKHDSVMLEACNASFQVHLQVSAADFANLYNIAQLAAAPVLAAGANSPLLFGRQLWCETRIALFQQAVDTRSSMHFLRQRSPRVTFGDAWVRDSVLELLQEDVSRFRALVTLEGVESPWAALERGEAPRLGALCLHNSTVYRWNRACYGVTDGRPHLRIENRVLPSGPSVRDEVANAAFWCGLVTGLSDKLDDLKRRASFDDVKMNFAAAARLGLGAQFSWLGETVPADHLICDRLLPIARDGMARRGLDPGDIERYLGVIDRRVASHQNGAQWTLRALGQMRRRSSAGEQLVALTRAMVDLQGTGRPVAEWATARPDELAGWRPEQPRVEQRMTTDLFTVNEDESLDLVACIMAWKRIRHVPVEDQQNRLVGLISYRSLLKLMARGLHAEPRKPIAASEVMKRDPITIAPGASILQAIDVMREHRISCLPVVEQQHLLGVITERDLMDMAAELLEERLKRG